MDRRKFALSMLAGAALSACGGGGDGIGDKGGPRPMPTPPPPGPELATPTALPAGTVFPQTLTLQGGPSPTGPSQGSSFNLERGFYIGGPGLEQFSIGCLELSLEVGGAADTFDADQQYDELTALGPEMGGDDGVKLLTFTDDPAFVLSGARSAAFHAAPDVRLQRMVNLGPAALHGVSLTWRSSIGAGAFTRAAVSEPWYFQVVVRSRLGELLATLYRKDRNGVFGTDGSASLSQFAGQSVVLSFERNLGMGTVVIDDISVRDTTTGLEFVQNGNFERAGEGWTAVEHPVSRNVRSGARTLAGLSVQRTFYAQPNALWGRMTDVISNPSNRNIDVVIHYDTNLGANGEAFIYPTPGAPQKGLSIWDTSGVAPVPDVGVVFGSGTTLDYKSVSAMGRGDGSNYIGMAFPLTIPARSVVTLINFVILSGVRTGATATDLNARAVDVDALSADIANNFRTNFAYQRGLTQEQLDTAKNL